MQEENSRLQGRRVQIHDSERQRNIDELIYLLGDECKLSRWPQLPAICTHMKNAVSSPIIVSADDRLEAVVNSMNELIRSTDSEETSRPCRYVTSFKFLLEQIHLLMSAQKRYSPECLLLAFQLFLYMSFNV
jgi:hypothetical protein